MKKAFILILSILTSASAQGSQGTPLPVTPQLKAQIGQYARQVAKRDCTDSYRAASSPAALTPSQFNERFQALLAMVQEEMRRKANGSTVAGNLRSGESGYVYINNTRPGADDVVMILSRQTLNGVPSVVTYACVLK